VITCRIESAFHLEDFAPELIQLLSCGYEDGVFAVGDDDQSIYSFRGGSPKYIQTFHSSFKGQVRIARLFKSWRCPKHMLRGARQVVQSFYDGSVAKPPPVFSERIATNDKIQFRDLPSDGWEASFIAKEAEELGREYDVKVLIPNSKYFPPIRDALRKRGIPYRYKTSPEESGIVRFAVLADWAEAPEDNLDLRYVLQLIIDNHDELTKTVECSSDGIRDKRRASNTLVARLWDEVGPARNLWDVVAAHATCGEQKHFFARLNADLGELRILLTEAGGKRLKLAPFLHLCGTCVAPGRSPHGVVEEIREWRSQTREANKAGSCRRADARYSGDRILRPTKELSGEHYPGL
jgi:hypothetical protein